MAQPQFGGIALADACWKGVTEPAQPRWQENSFSGVNGVEMIFHGSAGYMSRFEVIATADDEPGLAAIEQAWCNVLNAGKPAALVDSLGSTWSPVVLAGFRPIEEVKPCNAGVSRAYEFTFRHPS